MTLDRSLASAARPARRVVLGAAAAGGAAVVLGGCGGDDDTASAGGGTSAASEPAPGTSTSAPAESPSASESAPAAGGESLVATADVPVGGGAILQDQQLVVTQPTAGTFKAFTAVCTHQACLVGSVEDGLIRCPCHGSTFSAEDGAVEQGPATAPLEEVAVAVQGDAVVRA